jgi:hypothetical protein
MHDALQFLAHWLRQVTIFITVGASVNLYLDASPLHPPHKRRIRRQVVA